MVWSKKEEQFLKENYSKQISLLDLSKKIGRTPKAISHKAQRLNLSRPWIKFHEPEKKFTRKEIEKRYYDKNKKRIYERKIQKRKKLKEEVVKLLGGKCTECGYNKCIEALELHHKSSKEEKIHLLIKNESRQKLLKEAKKCILLCANCHREAHY